MSAVFNVVLPVALIVLIGYLAGRKLSFDVGSLSRLTLYIFSPALSFNAMYRANLGAGSAIRIFLAFALSSLFLYWIARGVATLTRQDAGQKRSLIATTIFPNIGNFGLSLTLFAFGDAGVERGLVTFASGALMTFGLGPAIISGQGFRRGAKMTLRLPMIWTLILGITFRALEIKLPTGIESSVNLLAGVTIPLLLIALGIQISQSQIAVEKSDWIACVLRLGIGPVAAYSAGRIVGLDPLALKVLVLQCCTPTAVNALLVAAEFGGDARKAARVVVLTSLLSIATIPIVMAIMGIKG
ncbi:MAG: AEC family transporter [Thermomicrobiales bacterium]